MIGIIRAFHFLLMSAFVLGACAKAAENVQHAGNSMHNSGLKVDRKVRSWFDNNDIGRPENNPRKPDTAFCYKTIGEVTCYDHPLDGEDGRLKGIQLPPPPAYVTKENSHLPMHYYMPEEKVELIEPNQPIKVKETPAHGTGKTLPHELKPQGQ